MRAVGRRAARTARAALAAARARSPVRRGEAAGPIGGAPTASRARGIPAAHRRSLLQRRWACRSGAAGGARERLVRASYLTRCAARLGVRPPIDVVPRPCCWRGRIRRFQAGGRVELGGTRIITGLGPSSRFLAEKKSSLGAVRPQTYGEIRLRLACDPVHRPETALLDVRPRPSPA